MATMIQSVDDEVGRIMASLAEMGVRDDPAVFLFSDNGGYGPGTDMDPLKGYKGTYYEGGIRVPFFVNWPGVVKPGQKTSTPMIGVDVFPTFCELAGTELPDQPQDGTSLVPVISGEAEDLSQRPLFWHFPAYLQSYSGVVSEQRDPLFRSRPCGIIRLGDWKLHEYFEDGGLELYNLHDDIGETNNLASRFPEKVKELKSMMEDWRKEIDAPIPTEPNPKFDAEAEEAAIASKADKKEKKKKPGKVDT